MNLLRLDIIILEKVYLMNNNNNQANIIEVFSSIQGEGPYIGYKQIFIRFSDCNLNCAYCDTDFQKADYINLIINNNIEKIKNPTSPINLYSKIKILLDDNHHSISFTGGEPLIWQDFINDFIEVIIKSNHKIKFYLETNGTLPDKLEQIIHNVDIVSMDLKLESSTNQPVLWKKHSDFIDICLENNKEIFIKTVITKNISDSEIITTSNFINSIKKQVTLILQPVSTNNVNLALNSDELVKLQSQFLQNLSNVRLIPQVHKYLNVL